MQLVFMLSQFDANSYTYLCARVKDRTYVTVYSSEQEVFPDHYHKTSLY